MSNQQTEIRKEDEVILVIPRIALFETGKYLFQGTCTDTFTLNQLLRNLGQHVSVMRRGSTEELDTPLERNAERNEMYKQPIPYCVVRRNGEVFAYRRLSKGGESRLHDKLSIGVGGHMNPYDGTFAQMLHINLLRELDEELHITAPDRSEGAEPSLNIIGMINDDADDVGKVHIGILAIIDFPEDFAIEVRETDQLEGIWMTEEDLRNPDNYAKMESWSKIVIDTLFPAEQ